jgi:hypothetical protein
MARYFLHLRDGTEQILDPDGVDIPTQEVAATALMSARDCIAGDVHRGELDLRYRIDVHDEDGKLVHSQPFATAIAVSGGEIIGAVDALQVQLSLLSTLRHRYDKQGRGHLVECLDALVAEASLDAERFKASTPPIGVASAAWSNAGAPD